MRARVKRTTPACASGSLLTLGAPRMVVYIEEMIAGISRTVYRN